MSRATAMHPDARLHVSPAVFSAPIGQESVLFDERNGAYFGLNPVAARVWVMATDGRTIGEIISVLQTEFPDGAEHIATDVAALIEDMVRRALWTIVPPPTPDSP